MAFPSVISLFSGIGGLDLGFKNEGFQTVFANDNDEKIYSLYQYLLEFKDKNNIGLNSIKKLDLSLLPKANIVIGGYPCQGFSGIGSRNKDDPRNKLFLNYKKVVQQIRPLFFVAENVMGTKTNYGGHYFNYMLEEFKSINNGSYNVIPIILNASEYGISQERIRLFFIGISKKVVELDPKWRSITRYKLEQKVRKLTQNTKTINDDIKIFEDINYISGNDFYPYFDNPQPWHFRSRNRKRKFNETSYTILASMRSIALYPSGHKMKRHKVIKDRYSFDWILSPKFPFPNENRPLSWQEAAKIQGFSIDVIHKIQNYYQSNDISLEYLYRGIGNAVPPKLATTVAKLIKDFSGWEFPTLDVQNSSAKDNKSVPTIIEYKGSKNATNIDKKELIKDFNSFLFEIIDLNLPDRVQFHIPPFDIEGRFYYTCASCNNNYDLNTLIFLKKYRLIMDNKKGKTLGFCSEKCIEWYRINEIYNYLIENFDNSIKLTSYPNINKIDISKLALKRKKVLAPIMKIEDVNNNDLLSIYFVLCKNKKIHKEIVNRLNKIEIDYCIICPCYSKKSIDSKIKKIITKNQSKKLVSSVENIC